MYVPQWETLADALARVLATGLDAVQAKRQICAAIADRAILVRVEIDKTERDMGGRCLSDRRVKPPHRLGPKDLDWEHSKPQTAWDTGPYGPESYALTSPGWRARRIATLELCTDDVTSLFCVAAGNEADTAQAPATVHIVESTPPASRLKPRSAGGRPAKYDWDAFAAELLRLANTPDGLPDRRATTKHMQEWCAREWDHEPSESVIRDKIARLYPDAS